MDWGFNQATSQPGPDRHVPPTLSRRGRLGASAMSQTSVMRCRQLSGADAPIRALRSARFEDVPVLLRLIEGPSTTGAATITTARNAGPSISATNRASSPTRSDSLVLWSPSSVGGWPPSRCAHCSWTAAIQGQGLGRASLAALEARARTAGCSRIRGAISLNAVPFYARVGFLPCDGPARLLSADVPGPRCGRK
jgi:hypothetical protein